MSTINPGLLPDVYACIADGDCMMPLIRSGDRLVFSRLEPVAVGDLVAVHFHLGMEPDGAGPVHLKRLVGMPAEWILQADHKDWRPTALFSQINPPLTWAWQIDRIAAVHCCVGRLNQSDVICSLASS